MKAYFGPDNMRACMHLGNIHLYPNIYLARTLCPLCPEIISLWLKLHDCKKMSNLPQESRAFKLFKTMILICSKLHWLVHPIFYLCWASFFWFVLSILCLLSYFYLVNLLSTSSRDQSLLYSGSLEGEFNVCKDSGWTLFRRKFRHGPKMEKPYSNLLAIRGSKSEWISVKHNTSDTQCKN